ncbi:hypothetical protein [Flavobacterium sp. WC2509]|uniref:hypothetical protein n=1 Tax=Flavobacterium sp. WC2509 TaxID=3461406 RepID=UPI004044DA9C
MKLKRNSIILNILFFSSLLLNFINLKLYEKTIIPIEIVLAIYSIGILFFVMFKNKLKEISSWNDFNNFVFSFLVVGSYLTILFLGANYSFAKKQAEWKTYKIVRKTEINGGKYNRNNKIPAVIISTENNDTKRIEFKRNLKNKVDFSNSLELELSKGLFNFYIIRNAELK